MEKEMTEYEKMARDGAKEMVRELASFVNGMGPENVRAFVKEFQMEHRTPQQRMVRMFVEVLKSLAENGKRGPGWYDLRNEASVKFAMEIADHLENAYFPLI